MTRRAIAYDVLRTRNAARISIASPGDFVRARNAAPISTAFPYCLDFVRGRALYVADVDRAAVEAAPFYYLYLRQHARRLLSVPIEQMRAGGGNTPVFLFSPGRCGSTLLSRVLSEAGVPSVSEPDFYTQMTSWFWSRGYNTLGPLYRSAMWAMSDDLAAALGGSPVVKLRAECARAPELLVRRPDQPTIVLFRRFENWSRSTAMVFGAGPAKAVQKYMAALRCFGWLRRHSRCHLVQYEDWLSDPGPAARKLGEFLGHPLSPEAIDRALRAHSQSGTPLEHRVRPGWEAKWEGALRMWRSPRLVTARRRLDLPDVWD